MQIQVRINEEGVLRNQRYAFTDRYTLVSELLQNARRAGATHIAVDFDGDAQWLRVADDGCGIDDFQKLLSFHESGWDEATRQDEHPFGVGFSKCLYAATRCLVASGGRQVDFDTAAALRRQPIDVIGCPQGGAAAGGTVIELHGVELTELPARIAAMCAGFPVEVVFNGRVLDRPFAADRLPLMPTPIGALHLCGTQDGRYSSETLVFLQGLCVLKPAWYRMDQVNVVHLDPRQFMARLPDRDRLIEEDDQRRRIDAALMGAWRSVLEAARARLTALCFVETFYDALRRWGHLDLLNDVDVLPTAVLDEIVGYPRQEGTGDRDYARPVSCAPTREDVESGRVSLVVLEAMDEGNAARWMLARACRHLVLDVCGLDFRHWAQPHARCISHMPVAVQAVEEHARSTLEGRWVWPEVVLCAAVRVSVGGETVEIADAGVHHDGTLYIPDGECTGEPVRQVSDFTDEHDRFQAADLEADRDALADLLRRLRSVDPADTLGSLLRGLRLERYPVLHGRRFRLTVGRDASGHAVELAE